MADIIYTPPKMTLPVSKGGDLVVDFQQQINDVYTDYGLGVTVKLEVDIPQTSGRTPLPPITVSATATITGYHAVCRIDWTVADTITNGSLWRCVVSYPTLPATTEIVGVNGRIARKDGQ